MAKQILQIMPADGWVAVCWNGESNEYSSLNLMGWALVNDLSTPNSMSEVVGLLAMRDQSAKTVKVKPIIFAEDLVNFRFYGQRSSVDKSE